MSFRQRSEEQIVLDIEQARKEIEIGGYYAHYKHPEERSYQVLDVGIIEETEEICVMYKSIKTGIVWVRKVQNFLSEVEWNGKKVKRFVLK